VQFDHRLLAVSLVIVVGTFWLSVRGRRLRRRARLAVGLLAVGVLVQAALGIATLVLVVPVPLAAAHQAGALALFTVALWTAHELRHGP